MIEMNVKKITVICLIILVISLIPLSVNGSSGDSAGGYKHGNFLVDYGNGITEWIETKNKATNGETVLETLTAAGKTATITAGVITIDGLTTETIGAPSTGGSWTVAGTTGATVTSSWHVYTWSNNNSKWVVLDPSEYDSTYAMYTLAIGFYPEGVMPTVSPQYKTSWTMLAGDSENSLNQWVESSDKEADVIWSKYPELKTYAMGSYSTAIYANGLVIVKYGSARIGNPSYVSCYEAETGDMKWDFAFPSEQIEMGCIAIMGDNVYVQCTDGYIYTFDYREGPGDGNSNVISTAQIPNKIVDLDFEASYGLGATAMVVNSGCVFTKDHNGMIYCFDKDLNLIWSYMTEAPGYYSPATVIDGYVFAGMYDGCLYTLDKNDGTLIRKDVIFQTLSSESKTIGSCHSVSPVRTADGYRLFITYSDGLGMNSKVGSFAIYDYNTSTDSLVLVKDFGTLVDTPDDVGKTGNLLTRYVTDDFKGIIFSSTLGLHKVDLEGNVTKISGISAGSSVTHASPTLVNNELIYISTYSSHELFEVNTSGKVLGITEFDNQWYAMATVCVVDGYIIRSDDNGITTLAGSVLKEYVPPVEVYHMPLWLSLLIILGSIIALVIIIWVVLRFAVKWEHPFQELHNRVMCYFFGENYSHNTKSKRKLYAVIIIGTVMTLGVALASLCLGSNTNMSVTEALSTMFSAIGKGGRGLTYNEMLIYNERLPRVIATISVGIGLSVAGAMYQAVIKNPLVEPYIMGVSSGAGTFAVAVILANFTFFGLFSSQNIYLMAVSAIIGGLLAFGCTMLIAEKTGGKSINYVLAGIIVGMVFSAIQSIMMIRAGTKMSNALSWLYGSFASISWEQVWLIMIPCLALSLVPLIWAKEFNLVLLGEDQAMQMGLNAKKFDRIMLVLASVLTAFCVAFCGIIGFVGLVIPHLARMIMGGDHRLMLPVAMAFGGSLMTVADLLARILLVGYELPVGAITTVIGVPVFAYLLIRRGGKYDA